MQSQLSVIDQGQWSGSARAWLEGNQIDQVAVFQLPLTVRFRSVTGRQGLLFHGQEGWGECAPFLDYGPEEASTWLLSAVHSATTKPPSVVRDKVPVNVTIPVVDPDGAAARTAVSGCATAKIKVADPRVTLAEDAARVRAVAQALAQNHGDRARVRIDVNGAWGRDEALRALEELEAAAGQVGLEYVEQPCATVEDLAYVRARTEVLVAADESIRRAEDPFRVVELEAADLAVVKVAPLGGVWRALHLAQALPIPVVVSSAVDTSVGLAAGVQLAAALPELPFACGLDTHRLLGADVSVEAMTSSGGMASVDLARRITRGDLNSPSDGVDHETVKHWIRHGEAMIEHLRNAK